MENFNEQRRFDLKQDLNKRIRDEQKILFEEAGIENISKTAKNKVVSFGVVIDANDSKKEYDISNQVVLTAYYDKKNNITWYHTRDEETTIVTRTGKQAFMENWIYTNNETNKSYLYYWSRRSDHKLSERSFRGDILYKFASDKEKKKINELEDDWRNSFQDIADGKLDVYYFTTEKGKKRFIEDPKSVVDSYLHFFPHWCMILFNHFPQSEGKTNQQKDMGKIWYDLRKKDFSTLKRIINQLNKITAMFDYDWKNQKIYKEKLMKNILDNFPYHDKVALEHFNGIKLGTFIDTLENNSNFDEKLKNIDEFKNLLNQTQKISLNEVDNRECKIEKSLESNMNNVNLNRAQKPAKPKLKVDGEIKKVDKQASAKGQR